MSRSDFEFVAVIVAIVVGAILTMLFAHYFG
jgi:hypothetical protein